MAPARPARPWLRKPAQLVHHHRRAQLGIELLPPLAHGLVPGQGFLGQIPRLGQLSQIKPHLALIRMTQIQGLEEARLGAVQVVGLQSHQTHGEMGFRVVRVFPGHELELGPRLGELADAGKLPGVGQPDFPGRGMGRQIVLEEGLQGGVPIHPLQHLGLEQGRGLPVRLEAQGLVQGGQGLLSLSRLPGRLANREAGFRHARVRRGQVGDQIEHGLPILLFGEQPMQLHEHLPPLAGLDPGMEMGLGLAQAPAADQQGGQGLHRLGRTGFQFPPEPGILQRQLGLPGIQGDFRGAPGHPRVAGARRQVGIGLGGKLQFTALAGDLPQQELVQHMGRQPLALGLRGGHHGVLQYRRLGAGGYGDGKQRVAEKLGFHGKNPIEVRALC
jgi:hypothetical protein